MDRIRLGGALPYQEANTFSGAPKIAQSYKVDSCDARKAVHDIFWFEGSR